MKKIFILLAIFAVSCTKVVEVDSNQAPKDGIKTIPYSVTVSGGDTRATLDENLKTVYFATGDKLYIESELRDDVKGILTLNPDDVGKRNNVTFEGDITYTGQDPSADLPIKATLVGTSNKGIQIKDGKVSGIEYPDYAYKHKDDPNYKAYCVDVFAAVEEYSYLTGISTFGKAVFSLGEHTAFLSFNVGIQNVNAANVPFSVYVVNGDESYMLGEMKTTQLTTGDYGVSFVLPVEAGTTVLQKASVNFITSGGYGTSTATYSASFGGSDPKTLEPKVYHVRNRTATLNNSFVNTGLPIVQIITNENVGASGITKVTEQPSMVKIIDGKDGHVIFEPRKDKQTDAFNCTIKGRGNTTWKWSKKPYKLKLSKKESLLGLSQPGASSKHWVLLANFMDRSLMRNRVAYAISKMTRLAWTPNGTPVELYIDGVHLGSYLLIEQVRVEPGRVPITEMAETDLEGDAVTGGYLLEQDFHYDNLVQWKDQYGTTKHRVPDNNNGDTWGIPFSIKSPDEEKVKDEQLNYIKGYISEAGATLFSSEKVMINNKWVDKYSSPTPISGPNGYEQYIDVDSFIDYWIVFEIMINHELGNPGSVYMYKPRNGKLFAGPCWDFDWGTLSYNYGSRTPDPQYNLMNADALWYRSLMTDRSFVEQLYNRFCELMPRLQEDIPDLIDEWEEEMAVSAELNFKMWKTSEVGSINGDENKDFHDAVAGIKKVFIERLPFIKTKLEALLASPTTN